MGKIWFVGAGPGHPDLITVQGRALIQQAGAILYAGSLVDPGHLAFAHPGCCIADSRSMTLEEMMAWLITQASCQEIVVRLQTGDPALYGTLAEMILPLEQAGIPFAVVPGVSSALAAAAAACQTLTLPEITQTVILTRMAGRTPMPPGARLRDLAQHQATLCLFLSATLGEEVTAELTAAGWPDEAPILLVQHASLPTENIYRTTLIQLAYTLKTKKITGQTMIIAGPVLAANPGTTPRSRLYDPEFSHGCRQGIPPESTPCLGNDHA